MTFVIVTLFPEMFPAFFGSGIVRKAVESSKIAFETINIRDFGEGSHRVTDDRPYGGGCGMVMKPEPLAAAIRHGRAQHPGAHVLLLSPQGRVLTQAMAAELSCRRMLILVCGRYEGVDERILGGLVDEEISIGDYILSGGEPAAMVVVDAVTRLLPGVLGGEDSAEKDSFAEGLLEHAHYTRPRQWEGESVPEVLLSGNHGEIGRWRRETALIRTFLKRPDLLRGRVLTPEETAVLDKWRREIENIVNAQALPCPDAPSGGEQTW